MSLVTVVLIIVVVVWIGVVALVLAICKASGQADADEQRYLAKGQEDVANLSRAPRSDADYERKSIDRAELEREAERLRVELPERLRPRLTRLVGSRRHRS
jgi:predicted Ser/Thr protein kinase